MKGDIALPLDLSANMITLYVTPPGIIILIVRYMYYNIREYRAALCYIIKLCSMIHVHVHRTCMFKCYGGFKASISKILVY